MNLLYISLISLDCNKPPLYFLFHFLVTNITSDEWCGLEDVENGTDKINAAITLKLREMYNETKGKLTVEIRSYYAHIMLILCSHYAHITLTYYTHTLRSHYAHITLTLHSHNAHIRLILCTQQSLYTYLKKLTLKSFHIGRDISFQTVPLTLSYINRSPISWTLGYFLENTYGLYLL